MFSTILIHSGSNRAHILRYLVAASECTEVVRDFERVPNKHELLRVVGALEPAVVVVDLGSIEALGLAVQVRKAISSVAWIGFGPTLEVALMSQKAGFDTILGEDTTAEQMRAACQGRQRLLHHCLEYGCCTGPRSRQTRPRGRCRPAKQRHGNSDRCTARCIDFQLLSIVNQSYDAILADLPELLNSATFELVRRAQNLFVVCTPEIPQ